MDFSKIFVQLTLNSMLLARLYEWASAIPPDGV